MEDEVISREPNQAATSPETDSLNPVPRETSLVFVSGAEQNRKS